MGKFSNTETRAQVVFPNFWIFWHMDQSALTIALCERTNLHEWKLNVRVLDTIFSFLQERKRGNILKVVASKPPASKPPDWLLRWQLLAPLVPPLQYLYKQRVTDLAHVSDWTRICNCNRTHPRKGMEEQHLMKKTSCKVCIIELYDKTYECHIWCCLLVLSLLTIYKFVVSQQDISYCIWLLNARSNSGMLHHKSNENYSNEIQIVVITRMTFTRIITFVQALTLL